MPLNSVFAWIMKKRVHQIALFEKYPTEVQEEVFGELLEAGCGTFFGIEHGFDRVRSVQEFKRAVPIREYPEIKPYIDRLRDGEQQVLWPSRVRWFAKSSGTTAGKSKFIPVTKEALEDCHYKGGKDLLAMYYSNAEDPRLFNGKHLVLGGTAPVDTGWREVYSGDLSGIIIKNFPLWVEMKRTPNREIALLENWEEKIERMARATMKEDVVIMAGVPSWTLVLARRIMELAGAENLREVWPNLQLYMHGGVSFKPYREQFMALAGEEPIDFVENYNASEGYFAIQDRLHADDMLLMLDYGIFYEFMPLEELGKPEPETLGLDAVEVGQQYAVVISTNAGLWRYLIGDTVRFTSTRPFRIQVSGRTRQFINAFGEEVIVENADEAVRAACQSTGAVIVDYTAGPLYLSGGERGAHEWLIEFERPPHSMESFVDALDNRLQEVNTDYAAKRSFDLMLTKPYVRTLEDGTFYKWLKHRGKLGGQHKVPRLSNDRKHIEALNQWCTTC